MDTTEVLFSATIALVYPFFVNMASDKVVSTTGTEKDKTEFNKHVLLITTGLLAIFSATMLKTHSTKVGLGLGGIITLSWALMSYWSKYNENMRIVILGLILVITMYFSTTLYNIENLADLFSFDLGSR